MCIFNYIIPSLSAANVLNFLEDAFNKLAQCQDASEKTLWITQCEDLWLDLFTACLSATATHIDYLLKHSEKVLLGLPESVLRQVLEQAYPQTKALDALVKFHLKTLPEQTSVFDALQIEKTRAMDAYKAETLEPAPLLTWKLEDLNLKQNFYRESDPFTTAQTVWRLYLSKTNDKELTVGVKCSGQGLASLLNWVRLPGQPLDLAFTHML